MSDEGLQGEPRGAGSETRWRVIFALFFASGAAALIYEVSWSRQLGLRLGQTAQAAGVVLAGYFAGMALGYVLGSRIARGVRPLLGYGVAELIVGGWALLVPTLFDGALGPRGMGWLDLESAAVRQLVRAGLGVVLMLPVTAALGATLPFMAETLSPMRQVAAGRVARAYAMNTAGAMVGVLAASAVLLVAVGVKGSSYLAAGVSVAVGLAAIGLAISGGPQRFPGADPGPSRPRPGKGTILGWSVLAALSGFGTLGLQVLYARMFALTFHNSTYTFGLVVAATLAGLAMGSAWFSTLRKRWDSARIAAAATALGAVLVSGSVLLFVALTGLRYFTFGSDWLAYLVGASGLVGLVVVPPMTVLGLILPTCWEGAGAGESGGLVVGRLTAINAVAAAVGAMVGGFVLLPTVGLWAGIALIAGGFGLASVTILLRSGKVLGGILAGLAMMGMIVLAVRVPAGVRTLPLGSQISIVEQWEGPYGRIEVVEVRPGVRILRQDLHYGLGSTGDVSIREYRQGLLPLLLHPGPREVAFLGLGTGLTSGPAVLHPGVDRVGVIELIPEVVEAARFFADANFNVLDHPDVDVRIDDARHDLLGREQTYDVIVSDLFVPWESKAGYLYTVDFYRIVHDRLNDGGIFCQWLPLYQLGRDEFEMIADGFASVFPQTSLWWGDLASEKGILALVGSDRPLIVEEERIDTLLPSLRAAIGDPDDYLGAASSMRRLWVGDWPEPAPGRPLNTDEHPRVEFRAPIQQRDDRLLTGDRLLGLFDEVLRRLPARSVRWRPIGEDETIEMYRRRAWQRDRLIFPEEGT